MKLPLLIVPCLLICCEASDQQKSDVAPPAISADGSVAATPEEPATPLDNKTAKRSRLSPALDLLPAGSTLKKVRIPRYDKEKRRAALVRAEVLEVISDQQVSGDDIELRLFSKEEQESLRMHMDSAKYFHGTGILEAQKLITVSGENVEARGAGGIFHLDSRLGFVSGPVSTAFRRPPDNEKAPEKKSEGDSTSPEDSGPRPEMAELVPEFLEPTAFTATELKQLDALLSSESKSVLADRAPTRELLTRSQQLSQAADVGLTSFTHLVHRQSLLTAVSAEDPVPPVPTERELGPGTVLVTCQGGMYIDTEKGHLSYLRNIEVVEARFTMSCSNYLKAFFDQKKTGGQQQSDNPDDFADLKTIVASGGVRVVRHDPKKKRPPIVATAETAIVDIKTGDMVLQGGSPLIQQGLNALRAGEPDLYLRLYGNGDVFAEKGKWTTVGDLASLRVGPDDDENQAGRPADAKPARSDQPPRTLTATCTGGIYFDASDGQIVYLEEVEIDEPRFHLSGADELKVMLRKKPNAERDGLEGPEAWSDVDAIVASGEVTLVRNDPAAKRDPVTATAAHAAFNVKTGDMILRGGTPAIRQGANSLVAGQPHLYLRFYGNGSLFAEPGKWTTTGDLANLRTKPGENRKPPKMLTASCEGGLYFDSLKGQIVYLDDIEVHEPRFRMNCVGQMKVFLQKRDNADRDRLEGPEAFSDVKGIVASGGVTVVRRDPRGKAAPITASAETATYDAKNGDIALQGGYPMIRQGKSFLKANEPGLFIRFYAGGSFYTNKGKWITDVSDQDFNALRQQRDNLKGN